MTGDGLYANVTPEEAGQNHALKMHKNTYRISFGPRITGSDGRNAHRQGDSSSTLDTILTNNFIWKSLNSCTLSLRKILMEK
uniref:Uncharacterized protein n=1 Tax=Romanomermis culicivorax TaxID=13658 RepID=A0A915KHB7_ROMCU